jgi:hypothetical protein
MASLAYVYSFQSDTTPYDYGWQGPNGSGISRARRVARRLHAVVSQHSQSDQISVRWRAIWVTVAVEILYGFRTIIRDAMRIAVAPIQL